MSGRPRKPIHIKKAQNTLHKCRELAIYLKWTKSPEVPAPPKELNQDGRNYWDHIVYSLYNAEVLSSVFLPEIYEACILYQLFMRASRDLEVDYEQVYTTGAKQILPAFTILKETRKALSEFRNKYGLDLASSQRIAKPKQQSDLLK